MKWEKSINALVEILDNPFIEKGYQKLKEYYEKNNMKYESESIEYLINIKFKNANNSNITEK